MSIYLLTFFALTISKYLNCYLNNLQPKVICLSCFLSFVCLLMLSEHTYTESVASNRFLGDSQGFVFLNEVLCF